MPNMNILYLRKPVWATQPLQQGNGNDLYCVGWGVKLYSLTPEPNKRTQCITYDSSAA